MSITSDYLDNRIEYIYNHTGNKPKQITIGVIEYSELVHDLSIEHFIVTAPVALIECAYAGIPLRVEIVSSLIRIDV